MFSSLKKTKIIATIGPSSEDEKILEKMVALGVDMVRLNFSHNTHAWHEGIIKIIRKIEKKVGKHIDIIADTQGPKMRLGNLPKQGVEIKNNQKIIIDTKAKEYLDNKIPLPSKLFCDGTKEGNVVYFDDGTLQVKITKKRGQIFDAIVIKGGILFSKKGVNNPNLEMKSSILSLKDKQDMELAVKSGADYIAISFLRNGTDITEARKFLGNSRVKIIAKIERKEALKNLTEIIDAADAVMIARGDLGIETPLWELPVRQKEIIELVKQKEKPVIVATQMLDSMIRNPMPTRAEVSDVATAVFDRADAVMLSGETASGKYPLEAVSMMKKILEATDGHQTFCYKNNTRLFGW